MVTKYKKQMDADASFYCNGGHEQCGQTLPTLAGLAVYLGISKPTLKRWLADNDKIELQETVNMMLAKQEVQLIQMGLSGESNTNITRLLLSTHGYGKDRKPATEHEKMSVDVEDITKDDDQETASKKYLGRVKKVNRGQFKVVK